MEKRTWSDVFTNDPREVVGTENVLSIVCSIKGPQRTRPPITHVLVPSPLGAGLALFNQQDEHK